jgi:hypothetical protein
VNKLNKNSKISKKNIAVIYAFIFSIRVPEVVFCATIEWE